VILSRRELLGGILAGVAAAFQHKTRSAHWIDYARRNIEAPAQLPIAP